ncbi:MAG: winged helix-turn-helix transcriptional regulator [Peptococcaceae bacterium]|nr:winged helix-turn-helix transcriptional regulator [Peptococcaceae bacterium]
MMQTFYTNPQLFESKAKLLKALSHPARLCIVRGLLERGTSNVMNMQHCLQLPQSTISQHLSVLKAAGIIKGRRKGLEVYYSLENEVVKGLIEILFAEN